MASIKVLDELLASKIAAGEVIERQASVVKELVENSLDAGATRISVYLAEGGMRLIRVVDNGEGISREDAPVAFVRHATSKISTEDDLEAIRTMGFRGEALASIGVVSRVTLRTRRPGEVTGTRVTLEGGAGPVISDDGCPEGTSIEVKDLFYNTPARRKFLKTAQGEFGRVAEVFRRIAIINPGVRFSLTHGSSRPVETAAGCLRDRIADLLGADVAEQAIEVNAPNITGYIGSSGLTYNNSRAIYLYVNGRPVRDRSISHAITDGYGTLIDGPRYPFAVLDLKADPEEVDINIHPAKQEVRFSNPRLVYDTVKTAVRLALATGLAPGASAPSQRPRGLPPAGPASYGTAEGPGARPAAFLERTEPFAAESTPGRLEFHERGAEIKNPEFLEMSAVGQLWGEFLIAENNLNGGEFFIIDAHGAAERAAFERLRKRYFGGAEIKRQMLLLPERVETTPEERDAINNSMEHLHRLGFELAPFGPSGKAGGETFMIKAIPDILSSRSSAGLIKDLAGELDRAHGSSAVEGRIEEALMRIACHSVIRGRRRLAPEEGNALLRSLAEIDFAGHCPHGRPVVRRFTRAEVETMFNR
ncbi:MAG: DNA mismatch repair endonuclease MutL [Thermodesulfobacteriota bacterium]